MLELAYSGLTNMFGLQSLQIITEFLRSQELHRHGVEKYYQQSALYFPKLVFLKQESCLQNKAHENAQVIVTAVLRL
jgi:hypothetical protein